MRQAIEEGFILDVLQHYTTYKTYYRLSQGHRGRPRFDRKQGDPGHRPVRQPAPAQPRPEDRGDGRALPQLHRKKIGGRAKAMVVTRSRLHAVRYKQAFDRYLADKGCNDVGVLVAFFRFFRIIGGD